MLDLFPVFTLKVGCRGKYKSSTFRNRCLPSELTRISFYVFLTNMEQSRIIFILNCLTPVSEVPPVRLSMSKSVYSYYCDLPPLLRTDTNVQASRLLTKSWTFGQITKLHFVALKSDGIEKSSKFLFHWSDGTHQITATLSNILSSRHHRDIS